MQSVPTSSTAKVIKEGFSCLFKMAKNSGQGHSVGSFPRSSYLSFNQSSLRTELYSEFGVRAGLMIEKVPAGKMGALVTPQMHRKKVQS